MANFKAGDMITNGARVLMVNRVFTDTTKYSCLNGKECYSLDNGNGHIDARDSTAAIDKEFYLCD